MRKLALLFALLALLPAVAFANDYAWTASHLIRDSYPDDCTVTIIMHGTEKSVRLGIPRIGWSYSDFSSKYIGGLVLMDEFQVGSHATGASGPLGKAVRRTYSVTPSGADSAHLNAIRDVVFLSRTLKVDIPADTMLTGPQEGGPHNSRVYYVRVYGQTEAVTCTAKPWFFGEAQELQVELVHPTVWVLYAVDMYIPPLNTTP